VRRSARGKENTGKKETPVIKAGYKGPSDAQWKELSGEIRSNGEKTARGSLSRTCKVNTGSVNSTHKKGKAHHNKTRNMRREKGKKG